MLAWSGQGHRNISYAIFLTYIYLSLFIEYKVTSSLEAQAYSNKITELMDIER